MRKFKQLTYPDRIKIESLYNYHVPIKEISEILNIHKSTLYREIKKGLYSRLSTEYKLYNTYSADIAQKRADFNRTSKGAALKIGCRRDISDFIEKKLKEKYSPEVISRLVLVKFNFYLSKGTIYNYVDKGMFLTVTNKDLLYKKPKKQKYERIRYNRDNLNKRSIELRPFDFYCRDNFGHWELDTVIGNSKGKNQVLLVLTERKTRFEIVKKIKGKQQIYVKSALDDLEKSYKNNFSKIFKSITCDNGVEFNQDIIERSFYKGFRTVCYFCHPYSSWERGSNENANRFIRRFIPKGVNINNFSDDYISKIQDFINNYPRKMFGFSTSAQLFVAELMKIA